MSTVYLIVALVVAIIAVIFALQNTTLVTISFFIWVIKDASLSLVLLVTVTIGVLIGLLVIAPSLIKNSLYISSQRKRIAAFEKESADQKSSIERLQAKVEQLLAERVASFASPTPKLPGESSPKSEKPI